MPPVQETRPESAFDPWEVVDLLGGFAVVALPLFLLAVPAVVLLMPLAVVGLALGVLAAPPLAVVWAVVALRRRARPTRRRTRPGAFPRRTSAAAG
jgi:hypothetical protein